MAGGVGGVRTGWRPANGKDLVRSTRDEALEPRSRNETDLKAVYPVGVQENKIKILKSYFILCILFRKLRTRRWSRGSHRPWYPHVVV